MPTDASGNLPAGGAPTPTPRPPRYPARDAKGERQRPLKLRVHGWLRWLHIYISMFSLLAILFFSLTGITLNHPDWAFTNTESKREVKGQLPAGWKKGQQVDWFTVDEHLRAKDGAHGIVQDKEADEEEGSITYKAPGYSADCFFNSKTGSYDLTITTQGSVGVMNDFHRGSNSGEKWKRVIDFSGILLAIVAVTGLGLLYYLKKVRVAAFAAMAVGALIVVILMKLATS